MSDSDQVVAVMSDILEELRGLRSYFDKFTGYNTVNMQDAVDSITGPIGYNMGDLHDRLFEVVGAVESLETVVVLK